MILRGRVGGLWNLENRSEMPWLTVTSYSTFYEFHVFLLPPLLPHMVFFYRVTSYTSQIKTSQSVADQNTAKKSQSVADQNIAKRRKSKHRKASQFKPSKSVAKPGASVHDLTL